MEINEKIDKYVLAQGNQVGSGAELAGILKEMVEEMPGPPGPQGPQGPQGNTGSSVDYPFELVNNLTTDDPEKGLSAAQGVVLKGEISQLGQKVDGNEFALFNEGKLSAKYVANEYVNQNTGAFVEYNGWSRTDYINVELFKIIKISATRASVYNAFYKKDKTFHSSFSLVVGDNAVQVPADASYIVLSTTTTEVVNNVITIEAYRFLTETETKGLMADIDTLKYRKPKLYNENADPNYEQYVQEAYIAKLPVGDVILKCYSGIVYMYTKSSGIYAMASLSGVKNGDIVPVKVYITNDAVNYPVDTIVGYVVFSDVTGFSGISVTTENAFIVRSVAENLAYSPIIASYVLEDDVPQMESIEVSIPSTIYAVVGDTLQLYYRSIFKCVDYTKYNVDVNCNIGSQYPRYYELTPTIGNIGTRTITFSIRDNANNVLGTKSANLVVVASGQSPANELNVLCVGASATNGGQWASELKRRLTASGGTPSGSALSNIIFVGRKSVTFEGKQVNLEATGGYQFTSYTDATTTRYRFNVTAENEPTINVGDVYSNNGHNYTIVEINISAGEGGYFSCTGEGTPQVSGTLTKVTGTGSATITYSSTSLSGNPFAYGGVIDMQQYADEYCNPQNAEHGRIDVVYTELYGNGTDAYMTDFSTRLSQMQAFITQIRSVFPNCKFLIGLFWNPDLKGGMGVNYGASGTWHNPYGIKFSNHGLCLALQKYITDNNLSSYVSIVNWLNEFDEENDFMQTTKPVNPRSNVTEIFGVNGVHPSTIGYNQMADTAWRLFIAKFCQS